MSESFPGNNRPYEPIIPGEAGFPPTAPISRTFRKTDAGVLNGIVVDSQDAANPRNMIVALPFSESTERRDVQLRYGAMAEGLTVRLLAVDNPGVGSGTLDKATGVALAKGDFAAVSAAQWQALDQMSSNNSDRPTELFGYSLGAPIAASLAAHAPEGVHFNRITLMESVGLAKKSPASLAMQAKKELNSWSHYKEQNPEWMLREMQSAAVALRGVFQAANWRYLQAMTHRTTVENLEKAADRGSIDSDTTIVIASGALSRVSECGFNNEAARVEGRPTDG